MSKLKNEQLQDKVNNNEKQVKQFIRGIFPESNFPWGIFPGCNFLGGNFPGDNFPGGQFSGGDNFPGGLSSRGHFSGHHSLSISSMLFLSQGILKLLVVFFIIGIDITKTFFICS